jgi:hypothetical protein
MGRYDDNEAGLLGKLLQALDAVESESNSSYHYDLVDEDQ